MMKTPKSVDHYLSGVPEDRRAALEVVRERIHAIVPEVEECISYSMPAFRYNGVVIGGFLATVKGCSYYPFSGRTLRTLGPAIASFSQTPAALHFDPERPLSTALLRKLLKTRIAEIAPRPTRPAKKLAAPKKKRTASRK